MTIPWKTWVGAAALLILAAFLWNREARLRQSAERGEEAAQLALKQQVVENESTRRQLQSSVDDLLKDNSELNAAFNAAMVAAPDAKPASASRFDTGPLAVHTPPANKASQPPSPQGVQPILPPVGPPVFSPVCVLRDIDQMSIEVEQIELQTKAGNIVVVGVAAAYVLDPVKALLAEGKFKSYLSDSRKLEVASQPRWGVLASVAWLPMGRVQGGGVLFPPITLLGMRLEPSAAILGGATFVGQATLGVRF